MSRSLPREQAIERALQLFAELVESQPAVAAELDRCRTEFFGPVPVEDSAESEQRLLEWFLFERESEPLGGIAARVMAETWLEHADPDLVPLLSSLLDSRVGVFEVTGVEPGSGVWVRDMVGGGEYPLGEPEAASEFAVGDLVIGRIYAVGEGVFRASPVAACVRNRDLREALRDDLERARSKRRGVPRLSQRTLEAMFFRESGVALEPAEGARPESPDRDRIVADTRAWLVAQGTPEEDADEMLEALAAEPCDARHPAPGAGDLLAGILSELAFHTELDLEEARRRLLAAWTALSSPADSGGLRAMPAPTTRPSAESERDPRRALAAFDKARAAGEDLESVFEQLERDLGLEPGTPEDTDAPTPDFPGVVGAMVEEYLWERAAKGDPEASPEGLRKLSAFGGHIGAFEDLSDRDLLLFTGCWLIERGDLSSSEEAAAALEALASFCRWAESEHEVRLWSRFGETLEELRGSVPRLVTANRCLPEPVRPGRVRLFEVDGEGRARRIGPSEDSYQIAASLRPHLRPGDLLRGTGAEAELVVLGCYPREVLDFLQAAGV